MQYANQLMKPTSIAAKVELFNVFYIKQNQLSQK